MRLETSFDLRFRIGPIQPFSVFGLLGASSTSLSLSLTFTVGSITTIQCFQYNMFIYLDTK